MASHWPPKKYPSEETSARYADSDCGRLPWNLALLTGSIHRTRYPLQARSSLDALLNAVRVPFSTSFISNYLANEELPIIPNYGSVPRDSIPEFIETAPAIASNGAI